MIGPAKDIVVAYICQTDVDSRSTTWVPWLGFIERDRAKRICKPVKVLISRIGLESDFSTTWQDVAQGKHVLGCRTAKGVYAVVEEGVRVV